MGYAPARTFDDKFGVSEWCGFLELRRLEWTSQRRGRVWGLALKDVPEPPFVTAYPVLPWNGMRIAGGVFWCVWDWRLLIAPRSMGSSSELFPVDYGFPLWTVYAVWVGVLLLLYPAMPLVCATQTMSA